MPENKTIDEGFKLTDENLVIKSRDKVPAHYEGSRIVFNEGVEKRFDELDLYTSDDFTDPEEENDKIRKKFILKELKDQKKKIIGEIEKLIEPHPSFDRVGGKNENIKEIIQIVKSKLNEEGNTN